VKRSHREIDADRRKKEAVVIRRLEGLTDLVLPTRTKRGKVRKSSAARKLLVLEASAAKIEQLQSLVREMATTSSLRQERGLHSMATGLDAYAAYMRIVPSSLKSLESSTKRLLNILDGCTTINLPSFAHGNVAMAVFNTEVDPLEKGDLLCGNPSAATQHSTTQHTPPPVGCTAHSDAQQSLTSASFCCLSRFFELTGWTPPVDVKADVCDPFGNSRFMPVHTVKVEVSSRYQVVQQWPASLRLCRELTAGVRQTFQAPWRCVFSDGELYEVMSCVWVCASRTVVDARSGKEWEKPTRAIAAWGIHDIVRVEPLSRMGEEAHR
jgi:hypothetical protein